MAAGILNGVRGCRLQLLNVNFNRSNEITLIANHQSIEHSDGIVAKSHENLPWSLTKSYCCNTIIVIKQRKRVKHRRECNKNTVPAPDENRYTRAGSD